MTIKEKLQADLKTAMLAKDEARKSIIRLLISEINYAEKLEEVTDIEAESVRILNKMRKNAEIMGEQGEIDIISEYLPSMLTEEELKTEIESIMSTNNYTIKEMGKIMGELKSKFNGRYNGTTATDIIKKSVNKN